MSGPESLITRQPPSDCNRILSMLRKGGPLTQAAFDGPVAADGWDPIPQIARGIRDLRKRGCDIATAKAEDGGYCTYTLISEPCTATIEQSPDPVFEREPFDRIELRQATLFDLPSRTYGYEEAA